MRSHVHTGNHRKASLAAARPPARSPAATSALNSTALPRRAGHEVRRRRDTHDAAADEAPAHNSPQLPPGKILRPWHPGKASGVRRSLAKAPDRLSTKRPARMRPSPTPRTSHSLWLPRSRPSPKKSSVHEQLDGDERGLSFKPSALADRVLRSCPPGGTLRCHSRSESHATTTAGATP